MTNPPTEPRRWEQPDFTPPEPDVIPFLKRRGVRIGAATMLVVSAAALWWGFNRNQSDQTSEQPSATASSIYTTQNLPTATETVTFTPEPSPTITTIPSPTVSPSETQPPDKPENDNTTISFIPKGKNGGELSAPAVSWGKGFRNIIRFTCNNSVVTAGLSVHNPEDKPVKTIDPIKLKWIYPRPCIGNKVNGNVPKHPSEYYPSLLGLIVAKQ